TATAALETKDEELKALKADSDAKLSEAKEANDAFKSQVETRLNEAVETNVDVKTALSMVNASSDEDASNLAIDAKSNTEALKQDGQADKDAWADFE
ncbi:MAG: hypothetical protein U9O83_01655, partial [Campylobacterota bacterium]|nr:hypothetical protein [Campylobacterota bacterium]